MYSLLIAIIYLAFISLGIPDSVLGSAWPAMHVDIGTAVSNAGIISMITSASTIISALLSDRLTKKLGTGLLTSLSVLLTAVSMLLYSMTSDFLIICLISVPYGLGAGAIDSALNNYVATNLSSSHMNWLHCCWGVGAILSPYLMSLALTGNGSWRAGYRLVAEIQFVLTVIIFISLPLWKKFSNVRSGTESSETTSKGKQLNTLEVLRLPGVLTACGSFLCYCFLESLPFTWASTYFNSVHRVDEVKAAAFASMFAVGMAASRALCGIIAKKTDDRHLIRYGLTVIAVSAVLLAIPFGSYVPNLIAFVLMGFGCGPVYPGFVHSVPGIFGHENSGAIIGAELAFAYVGFTFSPYIFGKIADFTSMSALPYAIMLYTVLGIFLTERLNRMVDGKKIHRESKVN